MALKSSLVFPLFERVKSVVRDSEAGHRANEP